MITPAISVLSATEGLIVAAPWLEPFTVPLTVAILIGLFSFQRKGTESVAKLFGPIMLLWFLTLGITGALQVLRSTESSRRSILSMPCDFSPGMARKL